MGLVGILAGLALLIGLTYRGWSVLLLAPLADYTVLEDSADQTYDLSLRFADADVTNGNGDALASVSLTSHHSRTGVRRYLSCAVG